MGKDEKTKWILLNVGGTYFMTSRSTITRSAPPNSPLHRASSSSTNVQWDRDDRGAYFIDRDPMYFQSILNYMRHGQLFLNKDVSEEAIMFEAEYYNLPELVKEIKARIEARDRPPTPIYPFVCQPDYLTTYINNILE